MTPIEEPAYLRDLPRFPLAALPTPLQLLENLSRELNGPRLWVKRDDLTGLGTGGNKTRKLEFLLGDALAKGAKRVVTFGAVQSNHARQTAAACALAGLTCELLLTRQVDYSDPRYEVGGNVFLDRLFGANVRFFDAADSDGLKNAVNELKEDEHSYLIPAGGSNDLGALGYVRAGVELANQCSQTGFQLSHVIHASSSAGTQAGLVAAFADRELDVDVLGVNVYHDDPNTLKERVDDLARAVLQRMGSQAEPADIHVNHAYIGPGYALPDEATTSAIRMAAELEGLVFDPAYSGKALTALIDQVNLGNFDEKDNVVLLHTGGVQSINVYEGAFNKE